MARIVLVVQPAPAGVSLTWSDGPAAFSAYDLPAKNLTRHRGLRPESALGGVVECFFSDDGADSAAATATLAGAGYTLYPGGSSSLPPSNRPWPPRSASGSISSNPKTPLRR